MRIEDALSQVRAIQLQVARTERFCCYRWAVVAASGLIAIVAAGVQPYWVANPVRDVDRYLLLWVGVAAVSVGIIGTELLVRLNRTDSAHGRRQTISALRQFSPCVAVGALATWTIFVSCPQHAALLPALWALFFSLGIFASARNLPDGTVAAAIYYLAAGLVCLRWGQADQALMPWTMGITFGLGQLFTSFALYRRQEEPDGNA